MGHTLFNRDSLKSRQYLNKAYELDPKHPCTNIVLGRLDKIEGNEATARAKFQVAYDVYVQRWKSNSLHSSDYGWFASAAEELGKRDKAYEIRSAKPQIGQINYYDEENLTQIRTKSLTKK